MPEIVALAFAIESPSQAMLICPMVVSGVPSFTKMKFLFVTGGDDPTGAVVLAEGDAVGGGVVLPAVGVTDVVGVAEVVGVTDGEGVGDGETPGTTAPPTASPSRHK